ncbi:MAG TPA: ATP-dependent protease LonB [Candidatus Thermoplasmatota archaeon]|nr:ATP-dependent protease LonB [Candidatus Thermoplasmatota archaeon]
MTDEASPRRAAPPGSPESGLLPPPQQWIAGESFTTTADVAVPEKLLDQVIGQDHAVTVVRKAAEQKRHVMLIGDPGTGKSMLARAMTEFLPREELEDVIAYPNPEDQNTPRIRVVPAGKGKEIVDAQKFEARKKQEQRGFLMMVLMLTIVGLALFIAFTTGRYEAILYGLLGALLVFFLFRSAGMQRTVQMVPKLLVGHDPDDVAPFIDATAAHSGALLGDVRHDPFQAGGLETPAHDRVEAGAIHKAHRGVLYIDEINTLHLQSQQHLLTAIQDRKFQITGQSERSSGAMVKTEPVPCSFILVAAGNLDALQGMHPALRSRIRGYGYEVYVRDQMDDTHENRKKLVRFVAQEVLRDGKIPHFDKVGVAEIIHEAQRRSGQKGKLTLRLRELGGLIRVAGDLAKEDGATVALQAHVLRAKLIARSLEQQIYDRHIEHKQRYQLIHVEGTAVGMVNGLAVFSADASMSEHSGIVMPIVSEVTPASSRGEGKIIATGKLGEIAKEAVQNISAIFKKYLAEDVSNHDVHIQFVLAHEGVEGDSASVSIATAVMSALSRVPIKQDVAMTGSLSVHGLVLPVGGVTAKIEAAAKIGIKKVLIPSANLIDVLIEDDFVDKIQVVPCDTLYDVLEHALAPHPKKAELLTKLTSLEMGLPGGPTKAVAIPPEKLTTKDDIPAEDIPKPVRRRPARTPSP